MYPFPFAQKTEFSVHAQTGLFSFGEKSGEDGSSINSSYTNNPYGTGSSFSYALYLQVQRITKKNTIWGLQSGYKSLASRIKIDKILYYGAPAREGDFGHTSLRNQFLLMHPYVGHRTEVKCPVIFTTAYDQYTLKAFKNQGIGYILKPYDRQDIEQALKKLKGLLEQSPGVENKTSLKTVQPLPGTRNRFMVNLGSRIKTVNASDVSYFMAEDKYLYLFTREGESYILDETITSLEPQLPTQEFFRISRKFIIHISSIREMFKLSRNRIKVMLDPPPPGNLTVVVSEDRAAQFRSWLNM